MIGIGGARTEVGCDRKWTHYAVMRSIAAWRTRRVLGVATTAEGALAGIAGTSAPTVQWPTAGHLPGSWQAIRHQEYSAIPRQTPKGRPLQGWLEGVVGF